MKNPAYRKEYDALEDEFALILAVAKARRRAGLSQAQLAKRMKTTQWVWEWVKGCGRRCWLHHPN